MTEVCVSIYIEQYFLTNVPQNLRVLPRDLGVNEKQY